MTLSKVSISKASFLKVSKSKFLPKVSKWSQLSFPRISENDTFESVILESVIVDRLPHCPIDLWLCTNILSKLAGPILLNFMEFWSSWFVNEQKFREIVHVFSWKNWGELWNSWFWLFFFITCFKNIFQEVLLIESVGSNVVISSFR